MVLAIVSIYHWNVFPRVNKLDTFYQMKKITELKKWKKNDLIIYVRTLECFLYRLVKELKEYHGISVKDVYMKKSKAMINAMAKESVERFYKKNKKLMDSL